jgi:hypothetical protein
MYVVMLKAFILLLKQNDILANLEIRFTDSKGEKYGNELMLNGN